MADLIQRQKLSFSVDNLSNLVAVVCGYITDMTGLQVIDIIKKGTAEFDNYPLYNKVTTNGIKINAWVDDCYQSDVYIMGKDKNNYCLGINVYNGSLLFSLCCSKDYGERYSTKLNEVLGTNVKINHNPLSIALRDCLNNSYSSPNNVQIQLLKNIENNVNIIFCKYVGENSQGFKIVTSDGTESGWILFSKNDDGEQFAILNQYQYANARVTNLNVTTIGYHRAREYRPLVVAFDTEIPLYDEMIVNTSSMTTPNKTYAVEDNCGYIPHIWLSNYCINNLNYQGSSIANTYTLNMGNDVNSIDVDEYNNFLLKYIPIVSSGTLRGTPMNSVFNLPKIKQNQVYLRRFYAPFSNKKFNFYLWYSPCLSTPSLNSFYKVGEDIFLLVEVGSIGYAIKV